MKVSGAVFRRFFTYHFRGPKRQEPSCLRIFLGSAVAMDVSGPFYRCDHSSAMRITSDCIPMFLNVLHATRREIALRPRLLASSILFQRINDLGALFGPIFTST